MQALMLLPLWYSELAAPGTQTAILCHRPVQQAHLEQRRGTLVSQDFLEAVNDAVVGALAPLRHQARLHHVQRRGGYARDGACPRTCTQQSKLWALDFSLVLCVEGQLPRDFAACNGPMAVQAAHD